MTSDKAIQKSLDNGFTQEEHFKAVDNIEALFTKARFLQTRDDIKNKDKAIKIYEFMADNKNSQAFILVKESIDKDYKKIYTLELQELRSGLPFTPAPNEREAKQVSKSLNTSGVSDTPLKTSSVDSTTKQNQSEVFPKRKELENSQFTDTKGEIDDTITRNSTDNANNSNISDTNTLDSQLHTTPQGNERVMGDIPAQSRVHREGRLRESTQLQDITFKDTKGKEHALTEETKEQIPQDLQVAWIKEFNLQSIDDTFVPSFKPEVKEALEKAGITEDIKLTKGSLVKLVRENRFKYLDRIKPTLQEPDRIVKQDDITFIFAKDFGEEKYFTSVAKDDNGEWVITSNAPKSENGLNNKIAKGGEEIYNKQAGSQINASTPYDDVANSNTKLDKPDSTTNTLKAQERQHTLENPNIEYALKEYKDLSKQELEELIAKGERGEVVTQDTNGFNFQMQEITYYKDTTRIQGKIGNYVDAEEGMDGVSFYLSAVEKTHDVIDPKNWERDLRALCEKIFEYQKTHSAKEGNDFAYKIVSKNPEMFKDYLEAYPKEVYKKRDEILAEYQKKLDEWRIKQPINLQTQGEKSIKELRTSLKEALKDVLNKDITNKQTGMVGRISRTGVNKISSQKALNKSLNNGYTKEEHYKAGEHIKQLFSLASLREKHADYKGRAEIQAVYRFTRPIIINNKEANALITMFENNQAGNKIYSLELEGLEPIPLSPSVHKADMADISSGHLSSHTQPTATIAKSDKDNSSTNVKDLSSSQPFKMQDFGIDHMEDFSKWAEFVGIKVPAKKRQEAYKYIKNAVKVGFLEC